MIGLYLFLQRTQRIPKEACNATKNPEEFAKILIERLEKVKIQREQGEREAHNLAIHCEVCSNVTMLHEIRFFYHVFGTNLKILPITENQNG